MHSWYLQKHLGYWYKWWGGVVDPGLLQVSCYQSLWGGGGEPDGSVPVSWTLLLTQTPVAAGDGSGTTGTLAGGNGWCVLMQPLDIQRKNVGQLLSWRPRQLWGLPGRGGPDLVGDGEARRV